MSINIELSGVTLIKDREIFEFEIYDDSQNTISKAKLIYGHAGYVILLYLLRMQLLLGLTYSRPKSRSTNHTMRKIQAHSYNVCEEQISRSDEYYNYMMPIFCITISATIYFVDEL